VLSAAGLPPGLAADLPIRGGFFALVWSLAESIDRKRV